MAGTGLAEAYVLRKLHLEKLKSLEAKEYVEQNTKTDSKPKGFKGLFSSAKSKNEKRKTSRVMGLDEKEAPKE